MLALILYSALSQIFGSARRPEFANHPDTVWDILLDGSNKARAVAQATMDEVRAAMKIRYSTS